MGDEHEEDNDGFVPLSTGTEAGIAAFFVGAPFLGMASAMLGLGEAGILAGVIGGGALAIAAKVAVDGNAGKNPHVTLPGLTQLRSANWRALFVPTDIDDQVQTLTTNEASSLSHNESEEYMDLGSTLRPHANAIFSGRKALFGASDAGKSNAVAVICEEIAKFGAPLFLLDTEDEYRALCDKRYFPRPVWVESARIAPSQAYDFAQWAMNKRAQVVVNLQSYEDDEAAWLMIDLIKGIRAWEESHDRIPCEVILDEATVWLPQNVAESTLARIMVADPEAGEEGKQISLLALLQRAFFSVVVRRGRKRGMGFTFAAQRIAEIDKRALQASWLILMKQAQPADFRIYKEFGIEGDAALSLAKGEAFVQAPGKTMERHQFRLRRSPHGAHAPGLAELRKAVSASVSQPGNSGNDGNTNGNSAETPLQANAAKIITDVFPVSQDGNDDHSSAGNGLPVSPETRKHIAAMREAGYPDRDIAQLVGLSGRKYALYRQVVASLGSTREA